MLRLLADEDFNNDILRGVRRRLPRLDMLRLQDTEGAGQNDEDVLEWAAQHERVVLSHDVNTLISEARKRLDRGEAMAGVIAVRQSLPIGAAIEDLLLIAECTEAIDWESQIRYLPL